MLHFDILANFSVAEQAGLSMTWLQTQKAGVFFRIKAYLSFLLLIYISNLDKQNEQVVQTNPDQTAPEGAFWSEVLLLAIE